MSYFERHIAPVSANPSSFAPLFDELHEPLVVLLDRDRDGVPARPHVVEPLGVAAGRHDLGDLLDVEAGLLVLRIGAPLAAAVRAVHPRRDRRQLGRFLLIARRRHHEREPQQIDLAALVRRQLQAFKARRVLRILRDRFDEGLVGPGVDRFGVGGDEVLLHPAGLAGINAEGEQFLVDVLQECAASAAVGAGGVGAPPEQPNRRRPSTNTNKRARIDLIRGAAWMQRLALQRLRAVLRAHRIRRAVHRHAGVLALLVDDVEADAEAREARARSAGASRRCSSGSAAALPCRHPSATCPSASARR